MLHPSFIVIAGGGTGSALLEVEEVEVLGLEVEGMVCLTPP